MMPRCPHCGAEVNCAAGKPFPCPVCGEAVSPRAGVQIRLYDAPLPGRSLPGGPSGAPKMRLARSSDYRFVPHGGGWAVAGLARETDHAEIPAEHEGAPVVAVLDRALRCASIRTLQLPDSIRTLGDEAFAECRLLTSVRGGARLESIGRNCFLHCVRLEDVQLSAQPQVHISAFAGCYALGVINEPRPQPKAE